MTHTPLTKAEREAVRRLQLVQSDPDSRDINRLLADLDAAEAERDAHKELIDAARYDVGERSFLEDAQNILKECVAAYSCEQMQAVAKALRQWRDKWAILLETVVRTCEDRDDMMAQRDRAESERDALKAKLADPRRVLIHETEVVATKDEIASLKARLADLSEADEELHTCRALVNATSENLSVDLERMVDDLAEANEKAALSGKDSHSWHELYKDTKAKLAACEAERDAQATELVDERDRAKAKLAAAESAHSELFLSGQVAELRGKLAAVVAAYDHVFGDFDHSALSVDARILFDAIAAARGGAS